MKREHLADTHAKMLLDPFQTFETGKSSVVEVVTEVVLP
jgi:hypothetical protein